MSAEVAGVESGSVAAESDRVLPLVRRWTVSWLNGHDPAACEDLLAEDYRLRIGTFEVDRREDYVEATVGQLAQFPGLVLTVHDVLTNGRQAAVHFTEHGVSLRHDGNAAAWTGVVLFDSDSDSDSGVGDSGAGGDRLIRAWAEEDYAARRRQLASGTPDPVGSPAVAPWDTPAEPADPAAESVVLAWLEAGLPAVEGVVWDDADLDDAGPALTAHGGEVDVVVSAGSRVAFHGRLGGAAADGSGGSAVMDVAGFVTVVGGKVASGVVVSDRLAARSALKKSRQAD